jgi:excisionase family DNA binding protein
MAEELFSVEQVAQRLGLHVRTVRTYVRDGRLKAVRIGKQYRIAKADLEAFTGGPAATMPREDAARRRAVDVTTIAQVDALDRHTADRITTALTAAVNGPPAGDERVRVQIGYDEERASMKIVVLGSPGPTAALLRLLDALVGVDT